jgi:tetratricopeptide (TPR) repeat protein
MEAWRVKRQGGFVFNGKNSEAANSFPRDFVRAFCLCLLLLLSWLPVCPARAEAAELAEAEGLLRAGRPREAYAVYLALLRERPDDDAVNFGLARSALLSGRPHQAIMAYERLLAKYPGEPVLYKEIAEAYLSIGDKDTAYRYLSRDPSLAGGEIGATVGRLGKRYERFQMHGQMRTGVLYDSNANQGPSSDRVSLGNFPYPIALGNGAQTDTGGAYLGGRADFGYRQRRGGPWWTVGDVGFYLRGGFSEALRRGRQEYNQWYRVAAGLRRLDERQLFDLRLKAEVFDYDFARAVYSVGPEVAYTRLVRPRFHLVSQGGLDRRRYGYNGSYTGNYGHVGQYARFFIGKSEHELLIGGRYSIGDARFHDYSYKAWEALAHLRLKLPRGLELSPSVAYVWESYSGPGTALETERRRDRRLRLGLGVVYRLNEKVSVETSYQYTHNLSNSNLYDYRRSIVSVGCAWNF